MNAISTCSEKHRRSNGPVACEACCQAAEKASEDVLDALRKAPFETVLQLARVGLETVENTFGRWSPTRREAIQKVEAALDTVIGRQRPTPSTPVL